MAEQATMTAPQTVDPTTLKQWLDAGEAILVDVREPREWKSEHIPGCQSFPLSSFDPAAVPAADGKKLVLSCQSGVRAGQAAAQLAASGRSDFYCFEAGLSGWKAAGLPVEGSGKQVLSVQRQTHMVVGAGVFAGVLLGHFVSPWWLLLSAFMGLGLFNAGATGVCPLANGIAKLPHNR